MRIQSEVQSYDFHESKQYQIARKMKKILELQQFSIYEEEVEMTTQGKSTQKQNEVA